MVKDIKNFQKIKREEEKRIDDFQGKKTLLFFWKTKVTNDNFYHYFLWFKIKLINIVFDWWGTVKVSPSI